ncbi:MAG TPA: efflux RND transporter periplasmic adaptor subunit [Sphingobium sp.]|nr:efflux RND transporter periplasmic adaptor subunit [Sphingobium sp.]
MTTQAETTEHPQAEPPRLPLRRQLAISGAVALIVLLAILFLRDTSEPVASEAPQTSGSFTPTEAQYRTLSFATVEATGSAMAQRTIGDVTLDEDRTVRLRPPLSGRITHVMIEPGARVTRGQPLFAIRATEVAEGRDALRAATANRTAASTRLQVAEQAARRQEEVYRSAGGAQKDHEQAQADLAVARAELRATEAAETAARETLAIRGGDGPLGAGNELIVRAPISGVVAERHVAAGQYINADDDTPLIVITDPASVWLVAQLSEAQAATVRVGDRIALQTPALPGRTFTAMIRAIGATLDEESRRLPVRAVLANEDGALKPGMSASFDIKPREAARDNGIFVPMRAVLLEGDQAAVWIAGSGRQLTARRVTLGRAGQDDTVEVTQGLAVGERIVLAGAIFVNEAGTAH